MYCSSLTSDPPELKHAVKFLQARAVIWLIYLRHRPYFSQILALLLPVTIVNLFVARQPVDGCLKRWIWLADDAP